MKRILSFVLILSLLIGTLGVLDLSVSAAGSSYTTSVFEPVTVKLTSTRSYSNSYTDVDIDVTFTHRESGTVITLPGFWYAGITWAFRFSPTKVGTWDYMVTCTDKTNSGLNGKTGTITATASQNRTDTEKHGFVRGYIGDRTFSYDDGTPFFWLGDTNWQAPATNSTTKCNYPGCTCGGQFQHIVSDRSSKGFTVYQTYFSATSNAPTQGNDSYWTYAGTKVNPTVWNERIDYEFKYISEHNMISAIGFGCHHGTTQSLSKDAMMRLARYIVARYACYNVVWITGQEITNDNPATATASDGSVSTMDVYEAIAESVEALDGYKHPNSAHMYVIPSSDDRSKRLANSDWHDFWLLQGGHGGRTQTKSFYQQYYYNVDADSDKAVKILIEGELNYEEINCGGFTGYNPPRWSAWNAMMSGAGGYTYGASGIWAASFSTAGLTGWYGADKSYSYEPWYLGVDKPGSFEVSYMKQFFLDLPDWTVLVPVYYDRTYASFAPFEGRLASYTPDASTVVCYFYNQSPLSGTLYKLDPTATYHARWFNPLTGHYVEISDSIKPTDGSYTLPNKPTAGDWAFVMTTEAVSGYVTEEAYQIDADPVKLTGSVLTPVTFKANGGAYYDASQRLYDSQAVLIDGNETNTWEPVAHKVTETFLYDFGTAKDLTGIRIVPKTHTIIPDYRVYGSNDNVNWYIITDTELNQVQHMKNDAYVENLRGGFRYVKVLLLTPENVASNETRFDIFTNDYTGTSYPKTILTEMQIYGTGDSSTPGYQAPTNPGKYHSAPSNSGFNEETGVFTLDFENIDDMAYVKSVGSGTPSYAKNAPGNASIGAVMKTGGSNHYDTIGLYNDMTQMVIDGKAGMYTLTFRYCFTQLPNGNCAYCSAHSADGEPVPAEQRFTVNVRYIPTGGSETPRGLTTVTTLVPEDEGVWKDAAVNFYIPQEVAESRSITLAFDYIGTNSVYYMDDIRFGPYGFTVGDTEFEAFNRVDYTMASDSNTMYVISQKAVVDPSNISGSTLTVSYPFTNTSDHDLAVRLELQGTAKNNSGGAVWAPPTSGTYVTVGKGQTVNLTYSCPVDAGKQSVTITSQNKAYSVEVPIRELFARLDFKAFDGQGLSVKAGDTFSVLTGELDAPLFQRASFATSGNTAVITTVSDKIAPGDTNVDGQIDATDLTRLARQIARIQSFSGIYLYNCDVNSDGTVNADDLTKLARIVARIEGV